jgi:serine protease Do
MAEKTEEKKVTKRKPKVKDIKIEEPITEEVIEDIKEEVEKALEEIEEHTDEPTKETEGIVKAVEPLPYDPKEVLKEEKKSNKRSAIIAILLLIIAIALIIVAFMVVVNFINDKGNKTTAEDIQLQYTETIDNKVEGVVITDVSNVVENAMPSIVAITSETLINSGMFGPSFFNGSSYATGAGSGIIVSKSDTELLILTNNHVVEGADKLSVQFINEKSINATIKGASAARDIAIISIPLKDIDEETANSIKIATMGDSTKLKVGNGVIAIGNALGYGQSVTTGVISALNRTVSIDNMKNDMIQTDAAINGGNSGGALLNASGEVIGINSAKYSSSGYTSEASIEGMGFAIPISDVSDLITKLMNGETLAEDKRGYLGVSGYMNDEETAKESKLPVGFYVTEIVKGSGAEKAGIQVYDIITKIDGKDVTSFEVIENVLKEKQAGDKVKITLLYENRTGNWKQEEVTVTLSSYKDVN